MSDHPFSPMDGAKPGTNGYEYVSTLADWLRAHSPQEDDK